MRYSIVEVMNVVMVRDTKLDRWIGNGKNQELVCESIKDAQSIVDIMAERVGA